MLILVQANRKRALPQRSTSNLFYIAQAILAAPMGIVQLMDLLGDSHEVVRNEAVLLLMSLTKSSPDIQKIAAFEGAFEHILKILK